MQRPHINRHDRQVLRGLAARYAEYAHLPEQSEKECLWRRHNALWPTRPPVIMDIEEGMWAEVFDRGTLRCEGGFARSHEEALRRLLYHCDHVRDDWVHLPIYFLPMAVRNFGWGLVRRTTDPEEVFGAKHYESVIVELSDADKIKPPRIRVDHEATEAACAILEEAFGDLLEVRPRAYFVPWYAPIDMLAEWRGLEQLFLDMLENPSWLHSVLERLCEGYVGMLRQYEVQGGLSRNDTSHFVGSGGCGFVDELPQPDFDGMHVRSTDMWGQATAQILSDVSPAMHDEFSLTYDRRWLESFGLSCYGCCEPLHHKVDLLRRRLPRLRRVSMSPRADWREGARFLGTDIIFSAKPNPAVFASPRWDCATVRAQLRARLAETRGAIVEIVMKDTQTCRNEPHRIREWTDIALEEACRWADV